MSLTTPTHLQAFNGQSGLLNQQTFLNCLQWQKWSPYKGKGAVSTLVVLLGREMAQPVPTKAFVQQVKTAAICMALNGIAVMCMATPM